MTFGGGPRACIGYRFSLVEYVPALRANLETMLTDLDQDESVDLHARARVRVCAGDRPLGAAHAPWDCPPSLPGGGTERGKPDPAHGYAIPGPIKCPRGMGVTMSATMTVQAQVGDYFLHISVDVFGLNVRSMSRAIISIADFDSSTESYESVMLYPSTL